MFYIYRSGDANTILSAYGITGIIGKLHNKKIPKYRCEDLHKLGMNNRILIMNDCTPPEDFPVVEIREDSDDIVNNPDQILPNKFFERDAADVAQHLLGKIILGETSNGAIMGKIVETEAYYGPDDPASRAYRGKKDYNAGMWLPGGHIFVYMVHANWMFNITSDSEEPQAVLIRAVEPLSGLHIMRRNRRREKIKELCSGPGKWSQAFGIKKEHNGLKLGNEIKILDSPWNKFEMVRSHRIGVRKDLPTPLRFYIADNRFVSKR